MAVRRTTNQNRSLTSLDGLISNSIQNQESDHPSLTDNRESRGIHRRSNSNLSDRSNKRSSSIMSETSEDMESSPSLPIGGSAAEPPRISAFIVEITAIASVGGILFGYDLGVIAGALPQLIATFDLNSSQQELAVSILYLGGGIGASLGGSLCDAAGRKRAILITDVVFGIGAFILYAAPSFGWVVIGRIVVGFAVAVSGIADVSYLHEIAPLHVRGAIVSVNEACISLGFLLAFGVGSFLSAENGNGENANEGWRVMFGLSGVLALVQFVGMLRLPESPKWLQERGRHEESEEAMRKINSEYILYTGDDDQNSTIDNDTTTNEQLPQAYQSTVSYSSPVVDSVSRDNPHQRSFEVHVVADLSESPQRNLWHYWRQLAYLAQQIFTFVKITMTQYDKQAIIALFLAVTQQFCGQANVLSYAPLIFAGAAEATKESKGSEGSGTGDPASAWATLSIGIVKFAVTVIVIWKIEKIGRRLLLLVGMTTIALGLLLLCIAFSKTSPSNISFSGEVLALPGILLVVSGYSMSFGPLTWLLTSELFPTDIRGRALGASTIVTYSCACLVTYTFLSAQERIGASAVFALYMLITCLGVVFAYAAIPDTGGGKSAADIETDLSNMPWWRNRRKRDIAGSTDETPMQQHRSELT